jgi:hypothetical protein
VQNGHKHIKYTIFTNISNFPLRNEIESLGVIIKSNLKLSHRNPGKWATVKFFFDVIEYIETDPDFAIGDSLLMLDTDCICLNDAQALFSASAVNRGPIAYVTGDASAVKLDFHGLPIYFLEDIYKNIFPNSIIITETIGGEFFLFKKGESYIEIIRNKYKLLLESNMAESITTEEQILTMLNADSKFVGVPRSIFRIWTTYRHRDIHKEFNKFIFLHLPSEKQYGLNRLFSCLIGMSPSEVNPRQLKILILNCIPINNLAKLYFLKVMKDLRSKINFKKVKK